ncbi:MAG: hypothetical protein AAGE94_17550 [Acidobacteriota bacterium]
MTTRRIVHLGWCLLFSALTISLLVVDAVADATDDAHDAFARGVEAIDLGRFDAAIEPLRQAVALDPTESEERVFLSGVFSRPYLPHFYLGWALSQASSENCGEAVEHLDRSDAQGVVHRFSRRYDDLRTAREQCVTTLLPTAEATAREALSQASSSAGRLLRPADDPARRQAEREVAAVGRALSAALTEGDYKAMQAVAARARTVADTLDGLVREDEQARQAAAESALRTAPPPPATTTPPRSSTPTADPEIVPPPPRRQTTPPPPPIDDTPRTTPPPPPTRDRALARDLITLVETVEAFADRVAAVDGWVDRQRTRCRTMASRARALATRGTDAEMASIRAELGAAFAVLRFVAGTRAFLDGEPRQAIERLGNAPTPLADEALIARHHLLVSASRFAIYRLGGELDPGQRARAAEAALACHALDPELMPTVALFSPVFRDFYITTTQNR